MLSIKAHRTQIGGHALILMSYFMSEVEYSTLNRYANLFLHTSLHYGFGVAKTAQVPGDVDRGCKREPHEGGWEFRLHCGIGQTIDTIRRYPLAADHTIATGSALSNADSQVFPQCPSR